MNEVTKLHEDLVSEEKVITLYDICKILGKRHNEWKPRVEELHKLDGFGDYGFEVIEPDRGGKRIETFSYTKKQALMVGARIDIKNIIKLVNKLEELTKPKSFEEIMRDALMLADKKVKELQSKIEADKPKVEYFDELVDRNLKTNLRDTAKELGFRPKAFNTYLYNNKYIYKDGGRIKYYTSYKTSDIFEYKEFVNSYNGKAGQQIMVTPKGRETFNLLKNQILKYLLNSGLSEKQILEKNQ